MSGLDISKDHSPCPRSPVKLNTVKSKRCRQESFTLNPSKSKWSSKSRIDEEENDDIDADEAMLEKIEATPTERTGYVSQTAVALQCRAMPPPCLKNPNVMNQSETDTDPFGYQRSKCANFLPARLSGDGLSRYLTDFHEIQQIGAGHFSRVFKVLKRIDGCLYAVKHSTKKFFLDSERKTVFGLIDQLFLCESQKKWNSTAPSDENSDQNSIDAGSSMWKPIGLLWPGMYHSPVTNALWEARRNLFENPNGDESHSKLTAKSPSRSRTSILYKFSSDFVLREQYRNPWNEIRTGKLVEDLYALAGTISFKVFQATWME